MTKVATYLDGLSFVADKVSSQVNDLLSHPGEKGRAIEAVFRGLLRSILPQRYALGTGFITNSADAESTQIDLVIYDEQFNAPIKLVADVGIFPIESVYAVAEVKSKLGKTEIDKAMKALGRVRSLKDAKFYFEPVIAVNDGMASIEWAEVQNTVGPRSYLLAIDANYQSIESFVKTLDVSRKQHQAFIHGALILKKDWLVYQSLREPDKYKQMKGHAVRHFARKIISDLMTFEMRPASITRYIPREYSE